MTREGSSRESSRPPGTPGAKRGWELLDDGSGYDGESSASSEAGDQPALQCPCASCDAAFSKRYALIDHVNGTHLVDVEADSDAKAWLRQNNYKPCDLCLRWFARPAKRGNRGHRCVRPEFDDDGKVVGYLDDDDNTAARPPKGSKVLEERHYALFVAGNQRGAVPATRENEREQEAPPTPHTPRQQHVQRAPAPETAAPKTPAKRRNSADPKSGNKSKKSKARPVEEAAKKLATTEELYRGLLDFHAARVDGDPLVCSAGAEAAARKVLSLDFVPAACAPAAALVQNAVLNSPPRKASTTQQRAAHFLRKGNYGKASKALEDGMDGVHVVHLEDPAYDARTKLPTLFPQGELAAGAAAAEDEDEDRNDSGGGGGGDDDNEEGGDDGGGSEVEGDDEGSGEGAAAVEPKTYVLMGPDAESIVAKIINAKRDRAPGVSGLSYACLAAVLHEYGHASKRPPDLAAAAAPITVITQFVVDCVNGAFKEPETLAFFRRLRGLILSKPNCGVRPIAIAETFLQLAGSLLGNTPEVVDAIKAALNKGAVGFKVAAGLEAMIHFINIERRADPTTVTVHVDVRNAFPSTRRSAALAASAVDPRLERYTQLRYGGKEVVTYGADTADPLNINVTAGVHQGCPMGGALFALCLAPEIKAVEAAFPSVKLPSNHDDTVMCGPVPDVAGAITMLKANLKAKLDLDLNYTKTQALAPLDETVDMGPLEELGISVVNDGIIVGGAPVGTAEFQQAYALKLANRIAAYTVSVANLQQAEVRGGQPPLARFHGLQATTVRSRFTHLQRTTQPSAVAAAAASVDNANIELARSLYGIDHSEHEVDDAITNKLLLLPAKLGGLGLGRAGGDISSAAYVGSLSAVSDKLSRWRPTLAEELRAEDAHAAAAARAAAQPDAEHDDAPAPAPPARPLIPEREEAFKIAQSLLPDKKYINLGDSAAAVTSGVWIVPEEEGEGEDGDDDPEPVRAQLQRDVSQALHTRVQAEIDSGLEHRPKQQQRFRGAATQFSAAPFHPYARNYQDNATFRMMIKIRVAAPLWKGSVACPAKLQKKDGTTVPCTGTLDQDLSHLMNCHYAGPQRTYRHTAICKELHSWVTSETGLESRKEVPLDPLFTRKPDVSELTADLVLRKPNAAPGAGGEHAHDKALQIVDVTVVDTAAQPGKAGAQAAEAKVKKYVKHHMGIEEHVVPLAFEISGCAPTATLEALKAWAKKARRTPQCTDKADHRFRRLVERLAVQLHAKNAQLYTAFLRKHAAGAAAVGVAPA